MVRQGVVAEEAERGQAGGGVSGVNHQQTRSAELLASDLMPECPGCHELNLPGSTVCSDCGMHLTMRKPRRVVAPSASMPICPNCIRESEDPFFCDGCGRNLSPRKSTAAASTPVSARLAAAGRTHTTNES